MIRLLACILAAFPLLSSTDWSQFRGPNGAGVAEEPKLPTEFGPNQNVVWRTGLPRGNSSPVLTAAEGNHLLTLCLERSSGKILWKREILADRAEVLHKLNDPASSFPITDGRNV